MTAYFSLKQVIRASLLGIVCLALHFPLAATHIVGGELSVAHIENTEEGIEEFRYRISLIIYFDEVLGNQNAKDPTATVHVFSKATNAFIDSFSLGLRDESLVQYSNPDCASLDSDLRSSIQPYDNIVTLDPAIYNDPAGYYFIYDRCCRNGSIVNIVDPGGAGQLFYLEFPPVVDANGEPFVNSSPGLFEPLRDFACLNQPYYTPFGGQDADGDSLVYSLSTPLNGFSSRDQPLPDLPTSSPYPTITFADQYSVNEMVPGAPALNVVPSTGFLTVTPSETGLFVFAVLCEEFRDGVKIGEVRRDFQMKVINCPSNIPPVAEVESTDPGNPPYVEGDTIRYKQGDGLPNCIPLRFSDRSVQDALSVRIEPVSHASANGIEIRATNGSSLANVPVSRGDFLQAEVCFPECADIEDEVYIFDVIVGDRSCAVPLQDTTRFVLLVESNPNQAPVTGSNTLTDIDADGCYQASVNVGETIDFDIFGIDPDDNALSLVAVGSNVDLAAEGIVFETTSGTSSVEGRFQWTPTCDNLGENNESRNIELFFIVEDFGKCGGMSQDTLCVNIEVNYDPPPNESPVISSPTLVKIDDFTYTDTVYLGQDMTFDLSALDLDDNEMVFEALPQGFSFEDFRMQIQTPLSGQGPLNTTFSWTPTCDDLSGIQQGDYEEVFQIQFVATDTYGCDDESQTIITVNLVLIFIPDDNLAPIVAVEEASDLAFDAATNTYCDTLTVGEAYSLNFWATDLDSDELVFLEAIPEDFDLAALGIDFVNQSGTLQGQDTLRSSLFWQPSCDALTTLGGQSFTIEFVSRDENRCKVSTTNSLRIKLYIQDIEAPPVPPFPNAFSPNGDGKSDAFIVRELPVDNCADEFLGITIVNRWGVKVFESELRDFAWDGLDAPAGVYFYHIRYKNSDYKGSVTLFRSGNN